jgi:hypothetical protein
MFHSNWEYKPWSYKFLASCDQTVDTPAKFNDFIEAIVNSSFVKEKPEWTYPRKHVKRISSRSPSRRNPLEQFVWTLRIIVTVREQSWYEEKRGGDASGSGRTGRSHQVDQYLPRLLIMGPRRGKRGPRHNAAFRRRPLTSFR